MQKSMCCNHPKFYNFHVLAHEHDLVAVLVPHRGAQRNCGQRCHRCCITAQAQCLDLTADVHVATAKRAQQHAQRVLCHAAGLGCESVAHLLYSH